MNDNYAFIDAQNLYLGIQSLGWRLDFKRFRVYLKEKYSITKTFIFIGYIPKNQDLYARLQQDGYIIIFKPVIKNKQGELKGNVDADLVLRVMIEFGNFSRAAIVTSDGDFYSLVDYLNKQDKLLCVMSPYVKTCSVLLRKAAGSRVQFMNTLENKLKIKAPLKDKT